MNLWDGWDDIPSAHELLERNVPMPYDAAFEKECADMQRVEDIWAKIGEIERERSHRRTVELVEELAELFRTGRCGASVVERLRVAASNLYESDHEHEVEAARLFLDAFEYLKNYFVQTFMSDPDE